MGGKPVTTETAGWIVTAMCVAIMPFLWGRAVMAGIAFAFLQNEYRVFW